MNSNNVSYVNARLPSQREMQEIFVYKPTRFLFVILMLVVPVELW